ncbi:class I SAM-dependent methyltransferase [Hymenobacter psychrotolerans]|uniref:Ribosomal RNA adenine dimethylase n=1 Tax=Hymenobacter psychrotolerans DSM 18569 TaxID=1121959 RepID=A0A1M6X9E0_9BACT|nr:rRNA adenine N-6-methyltransferase family protein [Hymenobacter psychrotolerans]SHL02590.1 Ribosomal RNA adenine dimethylase [Hymenobacter psychrotolerans DSM 18569]
MSSSSFLGEFLRNPAVVGSLVPSSEELTSAVMAPIDFARASCIVEYGPGTGVFTEVLMQRRRPGTTLVLIEVNRSFCQLLQQRYAGHAGVHILHGSADKTADNLRQIETGTKAATETLPELLAAATTLLETRLDPFVKAQQLAQPELVLQYEAVRRIVKTAARRLPEYRGATVPGKPVLVYDRREAGVVAPMLGNRSGRGLTLRYYTAASAAALPENGQGLAVKNKAEVHLPDYSKLGPEDAPYLLVVQEQLDGEGRWVVR